MEPLLSIRLRDQRHPYQPGDELQCEYQLDAVDALYGSAELCFASHK